MIFTVMMVHIQGIVLAIDQGGKEEDEEEEEEEEEDEENEEETTSNTHTIIRATSPSLEHFFHCSTPKCLKILT